MLISADPSLLRKAHAAFLSAQPERIARLPPPVTVALTLPFGSAATPTLFAPMESRYPPSTAELDSSIAATPASKSDQPADSVRIFASYTSLRQ